jgi:hypothetical protein
VSVWVGLALAAVAGWLACLSMMQLRSARTTERALRELREATERGGTTARPGEARLRITRPSRYGSGDDEWYEIEVLVSNDGGSAAEDVIVTPFVGGRPVGEATWPRSVPPGAGVSFRPRIPRATVLDGPLSVHAGNGAVHAWWHPQPAGDDSLAGALRAS